jgi:hypothetical protein
MGLHMHVHVLICMNHFNHDLAMTCHQQDFLRALDVCHILQDHHDSSVPVVVFCMHLFV